MQESWKLEKLRLENSRRGSKALNILNGWAKVSEVTTVLFRLLIRKNKYKSILKNLEVKFSRIKIYFIPCKFLEKKKVNIIYIVKK